VNKEQYEDLQKRLHDQHFKSINNECTASPIYHARHKRISWGYEEEYSEVHAIYHDCEYYYSAEDFIDSWNLKDEEELEYFLDQTESVAAQNHFKEKYLTWELHEIWEWIDYHIKGHEYAWVHGNYEYETVNTFITHEAAEAYVKAKGGQIWIDSLYRSGEFRNLLEAIANGKLVWGERP
jgi:hypothetical protein